MRKYLPAIAIVLYCLWKSRELFNGWQTRVEIGGSLAFLIWMLPLIDTWLIRRKIVEPNSILLIAALVVSVIGTLGSVNSIHYISLALAIASFLPFNILGLPWLLCMVTWTPAFGWFTLHYFPHHIQIIRWTIVLLGSLWMIILLRKKGIET